MKTCPECGGQGGVPGETFGDYGWHPCYCCRETGVVADDFCRHHEAGPVLEPERQQKQGDSYVWHADGVRCLFRCPCGHEFYHRPSYNAPYRHFYEE